MTVKFWSSMMSRGHSILLSEVRYIPRKDQDSVLLRIKNILGRLEADDGNWSCLGRISREDRVPSSQQEYRYLVMLASND